MTQQRNETYIHIMDAMARIQGNIAFILEAKAIEAEKNRNWLCEFVQDGAFSDHKEQVKQAIVVHEQLIEVIDGIVKMECGMSRNLKVLLNKNEEETDTSSSSSLLGDLFNSDEDTA